MRDVLHRNIRKMEQFAEAFGALLKAEKAKAKAREAAEAPKHSMEAAQKAKALKEGRQWPPPPGHKPKKRTAQPWIWRANMTLFPDETEERAALAAYNGKHHGNPAGNDVAALHEWWSQKPEPERQERTETMRKRMAKK
jgi:hypothetical protein